MALGKEVMSNMSLSPRVVDEGPELSDSRTVLCALRQVVEPLQRLLPPPSEVVLHDLSLLPNSIVAISGDVTGRTVGDPATGRLLRSLASADFETAVGYETTLSETTLSESGRLKSSTIIVRDESDRPVAALCTHSDVRVWETVAGGVDAGCFLEFS